MDARSSLAAAAHFLCAPSTMCCRCSWGTDCTNAITACGCPAGYFGKGSDLTVGCGKCPSISTPYVTGVSFDDTSTATFACSCPANYYFSIAAGGCHRQRTRLL